MRRLLTLVFALALAAPALTRAQAPSQSLAGLWDAAVVVNGLEDSISLRDRRHRRVDQRFVLQWRREGDVDRRKFENGS
jgi:hypothetical protein